MIVAIGFALVAHQPAAAHTRQIEGTILLPAAKAAPALQPVDRPAGVPGSLPVRDPKAFWDGSLS